MQEIYKLAREDEIAGRMDNAASKYLKVRSMVSEIKSEATSSLYVSWKGLGIIDDLGTYEIATQIKIGELAQNRVKRGHP